MKTVEMPKMGDTMEEGKILRWIKHEGEEVKKGFESIHDFSLGGLVPPLDISATDHEGGGWVQIFQVKGGKFIKETDWFRAYPEVLAQLLKASE